LPRGTAQSPRQPGWCFSVLTKPPQGALYLSSCRSTLNPLLAPFPPPTTTPSHGKRPSQYQLTAFHPLASPSLHFPTSRPGPLSLQVTVPTSPSRFVVSLGNPGCHAHHTSIFLITSTSPTPPHALCFFATPPPTPRLHLLQILRVAPRQPPPPTPPPRPPLPFRCPAPPLNPQPTPSCALPPLPTHIRTTFCLLTKETATPKNSPLHPIGRHTGDTPETVPL